MKHYLLNVVLVVLAWLCLAAASNAQTGNAGIGTNAPNASALLDLTSTNSGILAPRMTTAQKNAIPTPATGLLVYDLSLNAFYYYNGAAWVPFAAVIAGWSLTGNAGTTVGTNFLGTTDNIDLRMRTNNKEHIAVTTAGFVGLDTMSPARPVDVVRDDTSGTYTASFRTAASGYGAEIGCVGPNGTYGAVRGFYKDGSAADLFLQSTSPGGINGNVGINTTAPNTKVDLNGDLALRRYDTTAVNGGNNDYDPRSYSFIRITGPTAAFNISGFAGGSDGKILIVYNTTSQNMTINNASGSSAAANRILTLSGADIATVGSGAVELIYSGSEQNWIVLSIQK